MRDNERNVDGDVKAQVVGEEGTSSVVDALFDVGLAWAAFGVDQGKRALEMSAKTLERAAQALSELQTKLRKDAA